MAELNDRIEIKNNRIMAHERAGNHFLMESILLNFDTTGFHTPHELFNPKWDLAGYDIVIHMVRNGLDNLTAMYHWLSWQPANRNSFKNASFTAYLHGELPNTTNLKGSDPIKYWCNFVDSYFGKMYTVRYEDLKRFPVQTLEQIEKHFGLKRKHPEIKPLTKLVGHGPRKGVIGDYKTHFSKEDEEYFWSRATDTMNRYGYFREGIVDNWKEN